ncbi:unnamed protein product [Phytomonas sp. EM1]|nr:unnamed protein product [Phytomonas sp. EM1]|eukprot:CCW65716.1 unnamed protein product [Phytomonas sp. isolate EM1]
MLPVVYGFNDYTSSHWLSWGSSRTLAEALSLLSNLRGVSSFRAWLGGVAACGARRGESNDGWDLGPKGCMKTWDV